MQISIHAPLAGSDSTTFLAVYPPYYFNPRSPCGERQRWKNLTAILIKFQSTLPLRGATAAMQKELRDLEFQSTLPLRGATPASSWFSTLATISIHAPLAGSDVMVRLIPYLSLYFNPRSPCGERPCVGAVLIFTLRFQSTLPLRGATRTV